MNSKTKLRLWVTGEKMEKNLVFHVDKNSRKKTMKYINDNFKWRQINIYDEKTNEQIEQLFNKEDEIIIKKDYRIWVTGKKMEKSETFHESTKNWIKTIKYINRKFNWELIIIYHEKSNEELKRYYNYWNNKTFPNNLNELEK